MGEVLNIDNGFSVMGMSLASTALTGRMCSGAARITDPALLQNTDVGPSWIITFAGPIHEPLFRCDFHIMTHSPGS